MKTRLYYSVPVLLLALVLFAPGLTAGEIPVPVGEPYYNLSYQLNYQRLINNGLLAGLPAVGPFLLSEIDQPRLPAERILSQPPENHLRLFGTSTARSLLSKTNGTKHYYSVGGGLRYSLSPDFAIYGTFSLDREKALDPDHTGVKWRGLAGSVETAAIYYSKSNISLTMGRQRLFWGPQPTNLVLSASAEPLDLFSLSFHKGRLEFNFLFARLDQSRPDAVDSLRFPSATFNDNRFLAGHRLDLRLHRRLKIGFYELTLFGGEGRSPELYYLNPLQFFHTAQLNEQVNDNTLLGLDFTYLPAQGYALYGQLLIDDFQIDKRVAGDQEPNEIGLMAGLFRAGRPGSWSPDLRIEYVRLTNRTYHQLHPRNRFLHRNRLLGHPLGPDSDSLSLSVRFWPSTRQFAQLDLGYRRQGEGSIFNAWDEPWLLASSDYSEPFPTGTVERSVLLALKFEGYLPFRGYLSRHLYLSLSGGYGSHTNFRNISGQNSTDSFMLLKLSWLAGADLDLGD